MATMTKAQLINENIELRAALDGTLMERNALRDDHQIATSDLRYAERRIDALRAALEELRDENHALTTENAALCGRLHTQNTARTPDWQLAAQQRRAQYDAAVAQGRRVKFVGQQLVDY